MVVVPPQVLPQQERIERRQAIQQPQDGKVMVKRAAVGAGLPQQIHPSTLTNKERLAAKRQIAALERNYDLGRRGPVVVKHIGLVRPQPVLQNHRGIEHAVAEQRTVGPVRAPDVLGGDREQVQHATG